MNTAQGSIGKSQVKQFMKTSVATIPDTMTVRQAIQLLVDKGISGAPVVDSSGLVLSVVSEFDLMQFAAKRLFDTKLHDLLDKMIPIKKLVSVRKEDDFVELFKHFLIDRVRRILVLDQTGKLEGIVSRRDILKNFLVYYEQNQAPK